MEFQFHVTFENFDLDKDKCFIKLCLNESVKPLLIVLPKGNYVNQPMFTKLVTHSELENALSEAKQTINLFQSERYKLARVKAEIPPENAGKIEIASDFAPYYEWHCKICLPNAKEESVVSKLCFELGEHLSRNFLDKDKGEKFVTVRDNDKIQFNKKVQNLYENLLKCSIEIEKQKFEYCIFDTNLELDSGWTH